MTDQTDEGADMEKAAVSDEAIAALTRVIKSGQSQISQELLLLGEVVGSNKAMAISLEHMAKQVERLTNEAVLRAEFEAHKVDIRNAIDAKAKENKETVEAIKKDVAGVTNKVWWATGAAAAMLFVLQYVRPLARFMEPN